jgi:hypothetical protein
MKSFKRSGIVGAVALATTLGMSMTSGAGATVSATSSTQSSTYSSTNHTLTAHLGKRTLVCYRGKLIKRIVAVSPHCPAGWTTKKPVTTSTVKFSGSYSGTMSLLWSASDVKVTALTGTGTGSTLGLAKVSGSGSSAPTSTCDPINGTGILSGGGSTLKLTLATTSKACASDSAAPTTVAVTGTATVVSGTGKFAGAKGSLKVTGSFSIKSTTAGSSESDSFNATLSGTLTTK